MAAERAVRFGPYVLKRRIARGGMAEVFLAEQVGPEGFGRRVAVKRILPHRADAPDFVQMFLDEARLAAQLSHPNIVHIYDFGKADSDHFIAMEYVEGVNAGDVIKRGDTERMSPTMVARIVADAAAALHYAHELRSPAGQPYGLVHRDVSPANLMVSFDGVVKLCDFGIAKAVALGERQVTHPGMVKGKYSYMSPEQTVGAPLDGRSDVYTLAIVMWELLAGKVLVPRGEPVSAMRAIRDGKLTPIEHAAPWTPPELARAVTWGLATERDQRPDAAQFAQTLEAFIKSSPEIVTAMHVGAWLRTRFARESEVPGELHEVHPIDVIDERDDPGELASIGDLDGLDDLDDDDEPVTTGETASVAARRVPGDGWLSVAAHTPAPTATGTANTMRGTGPRPVHPASAPLARSSTVIPSDTPASVEAMLLAADALATGAAALIAASAQAAATRNGTRPRTANGSPRETAVAVLHALGHEVPAAMLAFDNAETLPAPEAPVATAGRAARRRAAFALGEPPPEAAAAVLPAGPDDVPAAMPAFDPGETLPSRALCADAVEHALHTEPSLEIIEGLDESEPAMLAAAHEHAGTTRSFDAGETLIGSEADEVDGTPFPRSDFDASAPHATAGGAPSVTAHEVPAARVAFDTVETLMIDPTHAPVPSGRSSIPMLIAPLAGPRYEPDLAWSTRARTRRMGAMRSWQVVLLIAGMLGVALLSFAITWGSRRDAAASASRAPAPPAAAAPSAANASARGVGSASHAGATAPMPGAVPGPGAPSPAAAVPTSSPTAIVPAPAAPDAARAASGEPAALPAGAHVGVAAPDGDAVAGSDATSAPPWLMAPLASWPAPAMSLLAPLVASSVGSPAPGVLAGPPSATTEPAAPVATSILRVQTDPVGAAVQVRHCHDTGDCGGPPDDGEMAIARCAVSPCEFALAAGRYEIGADADGAHERREITVGDGAPETSIDIAFPPNVRGNSPVGKLVVRAPGPCKALVDGRPRGPVPPVGLELRPGAHRVELRCGRRGATTRTVTITAGRTATLTLPGALPGR